MIIVSQDKEEIVNFDNVENIWISVDGEGRFSIEATANTNSTLGYYKTRERAKEVLREIIDISSLEGLKNKSYHEADLLLKFKKATRYEMPED